MCVFSACTGENVQVIFGGDVVDASGTSCSAPIVAGMVSLWNGLRLKAGKSSMGFINPFLYKSAANPSAFYDVTSGNNAIGSSHPLLSPPRLPIRQPI
jgi:tripeptidyl-peptidase-1